MRVKTFFIVLVSLAVTQIIFGQDSNKADESKEERYNVAVQAYEDAVAVSEKNKKTEQVEKLLQELKKLERERKILYSREMEQRKELQYRLQQNLQNNPVALEDLDEQERAALERFFQYGDNLNFEKVSKIYQLENETKALGEKFKNVSKAEQNKIKEQLEKILDELFELRETQKKHEVVELEKRVEELKNQLGERREHKKEIIQRRIQELTGEKEIYNW